ncbi:MAG: T9SS type A sorting domain-containing protein [Bacteroidia bacterium]|nr:T9SS type A sorting domain-containing protein [Bacteroidia bacterium]
MPSGTVRCIPANTIFTTTLPLYVRSNAHLIVCGQLNLAGGFYPDPNSKITITSSGQFNLNGNLALNSTGATIHNYGQITASGQLSLSSGTYLYNFGSGARLQINGGGSMPINGVLGIYNGATVSFPNGQLWLNSPALYLYEVWRMSKCKWHFCKQHFWRHSCGRKRSCRFQLPRNSLPQSASHQQSKLTCMLTPWFYGVGLVGKCYRL